MIQKYLLAGYPCLYSTTAETFRAMAEFVKEIKDMNTQNKELEKEDQDIPYKIFSWDVKSGLKNLLDMERGVDYSIQVEQGGRTAPMPSNSPEFPIEFLNDTEENTVLVLCNFHRFIDQHLPTIQSLYNSHLKWKLNGKSVIVVAPEYKVAPEIDHLFQLIDFPLPSEDSIREIMKFVLAEDFMNPDYDPTDEDSEKYIVDFSDEAVRASLGMTAFEVENALSLSLIESEKFDPIVISQIKRQQVKKAAFLSISDKKHKFEDVIGLVNLKPYLTKVAMHPLAQGTLIVGVNGCGKTYIAEALANEFGILAVVISFEEIMAAGGGYVGQAQGAAIRAFKIVDALSPCIAILDELEKGLAGVQTSGRLDSGAKAGVGSVFMKWIENKTPGVYPIATCNDITALPPAYKRAGRWDTIIGVDLPTAPEIYQNLVYYTEKFIGEEAADELSEELEADGFEALDKKFKGYSHSELMTIVKQQHMLGCDLDTAMAFVRPIAEVDADEISQLRSWMSKNTTMASESYAGEAAALVPKAADQIAKRKIKIRKRKRRRKKRSE